MAMQTGKVMSIVCPTCEIGDGFPLRYKGRIVRCRSCRQKMRLTNNGLYKDPNCAITDEDDYIIELTRKELVELIKSQILLNSIRDSVARYDAQHPYEAPPAAAPQAAAPEQERFEKCPYCKGNKSEGAYYCPHCRLTAWGESADNRQ